MRSVNDFHRRLSLFAIDLGTPHMQSLSEDDTILAVWLSSCDVVLKGIRDYDPLSLE